MPPSPHPPNWPDCDPDDPTPPPTTEELTGEGRTRKPPDDPPLVRILEERPDVLAALTDRLAEIFAHPIDTYPAIRRSPATPRRRPGSNGKGRA